MSFLKLSYIQLWELKKTFIFLNALPKKLNLFFKKSKNGLVVKNKSKNIKEFNPVTNFDKSFENLLDC